jgi:hypothetical protein
MSIDVEGMEGEVLAGLDLNKWRPWLMLIEASLPGKDHTLAPEWEAGLLAHDYRLVHDDGANRFYLAAEHSSLEGRFAAGTGKRSPPGVLG